MPRVCPCTGSSVVLVSHGEYDTANSGGVDGLVHLTIDNASGEDRKGERYG